MIFMRLLCVIVFVCCLTAETFGQNPIVEHVKKRLLVESFSQLDAQDHEFFSKASDADLKWIFAKSDNLFVLEAKWEQTHRKILADPTQKMDLDRSQKILQDFLDIVQKRVGVDVPQCWRWYWSRKILNDNQAFGTWNEKRHEIDAYGDWNVIDSNADKLIIESQPRNRYEIGTQLWEKAGELSATAKDGKNQWRTQIIPIESPHGIRIGLPGNTLAVHVYEKDPYTYVWMLNSGNSAGLIELKSKSGEVTGYFTLGPNW